MNDFSYLSEGEVYLDSACQSLRPTPVINAINEYYTKFNSCGERVKYPWGVETDKRVNETRRKVLRFLHLSERDYFVSFTLNTTYGINLILSQIRKGKFQRVVTSEIEHNSPFLSTMAFAKRTGVERMVLPRDEDGSLKIGGGESLEKAVVVVNAASNIDGRRLENIREVILETHRRGGIVIVDAAQAMAHSHEILHKTEADAICFSAHKMYAPSLGVMVVKKSLVSLLKPGFIGGGMVDDVFKEKYLLSSEGNEEHLYTRFEPGLQAFGEAVALGEAIEWLERTEKHEKKEFVRRYTEMFEFLNESKKVKLVNKVANPTMSFYIEGLDSHLLGEALGAEKIMARTGYFCAHYYLDKVRHLPPLVRFSMGYHNKDEDIEKVKRVMRKIV